MELSFIHLHNHSEYSILDGCLKVSDLVEAASQERHAGRGPHRPRQHLRGRRRSSRRPRPRASSPSSAVRSTSRRGAGSTRGRRNEETHHYHLVLLVKNEKGYQNLCQLLTKAYLEGFYYRPRIDKEILAGTDRGAHRPLGLPQGRGQLPPGAGPGRARREGRRGSTPRSSPRAISTSSSRTTASSRRRTSTRRSSPWPGSSACRWWRRTTSISSSRRTPRPTTSSSASRPTRRSPTRTGCGSAGDQFYFKSAAEMAELFKDVPEAIENTARIAAHCDFDFPAHVHFLPNFRPPDDSSLSEYFEAVAREGFRARMEQLKRKIEAGGTNGNGHTLKEYEERLDREIRLIKEMGFEGYFLIVWDLIKAAREKGIPVGPGRGSAAGSMVAYCLGITEIDPIEYDLLFERFLNPERISLPDIDMDFCARRRQEMIEYVTKKYGQDNVSQIITFGTMAARAAIRDVGRVLEVPLPEVDRIAKLIPAFGPDATLDAAIEDRPRAPRAPREEHQDRPAHGHRPEARGPGPPRLHPRRRRRHHAEAARRVRAALPVGQGRDHDPVRDGRHRGHRPAQDGPAGPPQPDGHRRRPQAHRKGHGRADRHRRHPPRRPGDLRPLQGRATPTASSSSRARA